MFFPSTDWQYGRVIRTIPWLPMQTPMFFAIFLGFKIIEEYQGEMQEILLEAYFSPDSPKPSWPHLLFPHENTCVKSLLIEGFMLGLDIISFLKFQKIKI